MRRRDTTFVTDCGSAPFLTSATASAEEALCAMLFGRAFMTAAESVLLARGHCVLVSQTEPLPQVEGQAAAHPDAYLSRETTWRQVWRLDGAYDESRWVVRSITQTI
jgi:hypothetical protein